MAKQPYTVLSGCMLPASSAKGVRPERKDGEAAFAAGARVMLENYAPTDKMVARGLLKPGHDTPGSPARRASK